MSVTETKSEIKKALVPLIVLTAAAVVLPGLLPGFSQPGIALGTSYSSGSFTVLDPVIDSGTQTSASASFGLGQSISQIAIGKSASASFELWSGFQYFFQVAANTLNATPGDSEVDLDWTVPVGSLGISAASYEVGTGTVSGSYVFESVGAVTSFTKTGLTNGTPYYFIVKAYSAGGTFLVYSNEATATPVGVVPTPTPPSGGGGGGQQTQAGAVAVSGIAYPGATVTFLRDSVIIGTVTADSSGSFSRTFSGITPGTYSFSLYATDPDGTRSPALSFEQAITQSVTAQKHGLILAPTIQTSLQQVAQGNQLIVSGYAAPNAPVSLSFAGPQSWTASAVSDAAGFYSYVLDTTGRPKAQYSVSARATVNGTPSPNSFSVLFRIGDADILPPEPGMCAARSDLNCDGRVNLIDFSILLYFWDLQDFSRNPRADIDGNGDVGLRDLSIMLYDWTG